MTRWNNVHGQLFINFSPEDPLRVRIDGAPLDGTLIIYFLSSGYYDPGRISGPPEDCYPPESDDERLPASPPEISWREGDEHKTLILNEDQTDQVFDLYEEEIYATELDEEEPEYPDEGWEV